MGRKGRRRKWEEREGKRDGEMGEEGSKRGGRKGGREGKEGGGRGGHTLQLRSWVSRIFLAARSL